MNLTDKPAAAKRTKDPSYHVFKQVARAGKPMGEDEQCWKQLTDTPVKAPSRKDAIRQVTQGKPGSDHSSEGTFMVINQSQVAVLTRSSQRVEQELWT